MNIPDEVVRRSITQDAEYVGNLIYDLIQPERSDYAPVISLCVAPYLSLFVHESYQKIRVSDPSSVTVLSEDVKRIVARSRHSLKLFEDNQRWIEGQLTYFHDEILPAHKKYFLERPSFGLGYLLGKDLGIYEYRNRPIATTHGANFLVGIEAAEIFTLGSKMGSIYEEYGKYFSQFGANLDGNDATFVRMLNSHDFNQKPIDHRSQSYYRSIFAGVGDTNVRVLLSVFQCMTGFAHRIMLGADIDLKLTPFKMYYLTLYQVLASLRMLYDNSVVYGLDARSRQILKELLNDKDVLIIMDRTVKPFRNTMMHYNLHRSVDVNRIDFADPLFGLIPIYFPSHTTASFTKLVGRTLQLTDKTLENWART